MSSVIEDIFAQNVFSDDVMKERLPKDVYKKLRKTIDNGEELDASIADVVAQAMKTWALEKGCTHYTHWFQPMTGITAEKHDSFLDPKKNGSIEMEFTGKELIKGEPDASSFPSGGLRATFEARGYTAWDCTSPAFVKETAAGNILCIPTVFCSYTGEALDKKTPLLRSIDALSTQAIRVLRLFGDQTSQRVNCSVGPEQEYFLISRENFLKRKDLIYSGRTLFGAAPSKGQELEDHYFGTIREKIGGYMSDLNKELWKLGVYAKTQHNEVAPAQHELAPVYATANVAVDHNQITMETMKTVARRHGLECLLHEKPFAGVNGSGKHNNWSIVTDTGKNLLDPGKTPHENLQFLLFLVAVIKAVDENALLLRLAASNPGNDHRLGANEAPPAIVSIFLGDQLEDIIDQIAENGVATSVKQGGVLKTGVSTVPDVNKDATDRNRTSPFAFTGNKFEFRMVASSTSIACANVMLNAATASVLKEFADHLTSVKGDLHDETLKLLQKTINEHKRVIFNGNGYSDEWVKEAEKRGLPNAKSFVDAVPALVEPRVIKMMEELKVYSELELKSRAEIQYENYSKTIGIEAKTMIEMANKQYIPSIIKYTTSLATSINAIKATGCTETSVQEELLAKVSKGLVAAQKASVKLEKVLAKASSFDNEKDTANYYKTEVQAAMAALRKPIDELELIVDKEFWPVPSYGDMMFEVR